MYWWESISINTQDFKGIFLLGDEKGLEGQHRKLSYTSAHVLRPLGITLCHLFEFAQEANLHNSAVWTALRRRKLLSAKCFYIYMLIKRNESEMVRSGLKRYHLRKKEYFWPISDSCLTGVTNKLWRTSEWTNFKIEMFSKPLRYHTHACSVLRGASLSNLKFSMPQEVRKGPFATLNTKSSRNFFKRISRTNVVLFIYFQR